MALGLSLLMLIPTAAHLHFAEEVSLEDNLLLFASCFAGFAVILSAIILGMVQDLFVPSGKGKIRTSNLLTIVVFLAFVYLGVYLGLAFTIEYLEADIFVISDVLKEIREMKAELRFLLLQCTAICTTYALSILAIFYDRYINVSE
ncbi:MAG: hypothetical protein ACXACI_00995 [Candidatus Hodarchaeales archaeon]|jgi:hypothetical protein